MNLIMYTAKFDTFLFYQLVWSNFEKIRRVLFHQMNEHEISIHINNNSRIQILQPEFTTWKYKVKLNAEAASGAAL